MNITVGVSGAGRKHPCSRCGLPIPKGAGRLQLKVMAGQTEVRGTRSICAECLKGMLQEIKIINESTTVH